MDSKLSYLKTDNNTFINEQNQEKKRGLKSKEENRVKEKQFVILYR